MVDQPQTAVKSQDDILRMLLKERLALEGELAPKQARLKKVNDLLRDALIKRGREYIDESLNLVAYVDKRPRYEYDAQALLNHYPDIATQEGLVIGAIDVARLEALVQEGVLTRSELDQKGVRKVARVVPTLVVRHWRGAGASSA